MDVVISHVRSDFDAVGATVAAALAYAGAVPIVQEDLDGPVRQFVALHKDALGLKHLAEVPLARVTRVIVVDTASAGRLGPLAEALRDRPDVEWVVYDHHPEAPDDLPTGQGARSRLGSATAMLVGELERRDVEVGALQATAMALGIYDDTGSLTYPSTRPADARAVAWLLERGAQLEQIGRYLQVELTAPQQALLKTLLHASEPTQLRGYRVLLAGARVDGNVSGVSDVVHKLLGLVDVDVAIVAVEMGNRTQFVGRARVTGVDLREALAAFGGRGHAQACAAHAKGLAYEDALEATRERLEALLPAEPLAADLMSAPVRTAGPDDPVTEVRDRLGRYGHTALVVLAGDRLAGVISRRDIDRAAHHGLGGVRVAEVMTRHVITAPPEAPLSALLALVLKHDIGRLPIVQGGAVVGIVTRSDLLKISAERQAGRGQATHPDVSGWRERLQALWPPEWLELLERVGELAGRQPLYLVGGAVRDLLLGRPNLDVDLVVEGDAIAVARAVAQALAAELPGTKLKAHLPFGTAHIALPDGRKLDLASARTEFYERPAALPTVEFSSIKQDLARRDFSVNALALRVDPGHFGELLDFFDGRADLEQGELRVLHNLSFVEDPTRLLRGVRFELQLGPRPFRLAPETEAYARFALADGRFDGLGGERVKQELRRLLLRPDPLSALQRLADLDAWRMVDPLLAPGPETWRAAVALRRVLRRASLDTDPLRWLAYLAVVLRPLRADRLREVLAKLNLAGAEVKLVAEALDNADRLIDAGEVMALAPADLVLTLKTGPEVMLALLAAIAAPPQRRVLARYWREWRPIKLSVDGNDLKALGLPPGPEYARILREVLNARLGGVVRTPAEERALLTRLATGTPP